MSSQMKLQATMASRGPSQNCKVWLVFTGTFLSAVKWFNGLTQRILCDSIQGKSDHSHGKAILKENGNGLICSLWYVVGRKKLNIYMRLKWCCWWCIQVLPAGLFSFQLLVVHEVENDTGKSFISHISFHLQIEILILDWKCSKTSAEYELADQPNQSWILVERSSRFHSGVAGISPPKDLVLQGRWDPSSNLAPFRDLPP